MNQGEPYTYYPLYGGTPPPMTSADYVGEGISPGTSACVGFTLFAVIVVGIVLAIYFGVKGSTPKQAPPPPSLHDPSMLVVPPRTPMSSTSPPSLTLDPPHDLQQEPLVSTGPSETPIPVVIPSTTGRDDTIVPSSTVPPVDPQEASSTLASPLAATSDIPLRPADGSSGTTEDPLVFTAPDASTASNEQTPVDASTQDPTGPEGIQSSTHEELVDLATVDGSTGSEAPTPDPSTGSDPDLSQTSSGPFFDFSISSSFLGDGSISPPILTEQADVQASPSPNFFQSLNMGDKVGFVAGIVLTGIAILCCCFLAGVWRRKKKREQLLYDISMGIYPKEDAEEEVSVSKAAKKSKKSSKKGSVKDEPISDNDRSEINEAIRHAEELNAYEKPVNADSRFIEMDGFLDPVDPNPGQDVDEGDASLSSSRKNSGSDLDVLEADHPSQKEAAARLDIDSDGESPAPPLLSAAMGLSATKNDESKESPRSIISLSVNPKSTLTRQADDYLDSFGHLWTDSTTSKKPPDIDRQESRLRIE